MGFLHIFNPDLQQTTKNYIYKKKKEKKIIIDFVYMKN